MVLFKRWEKQVEHPPPFLLCSSRQVTFPTVTVLLMPDAVYTLTWAPDDGWRYHPKHVERFTDINKMCICILLDNYWHIFHDARTLECKMKILIMKLSSVSCYFVCLLIATHSLTLLTPILRLMLGTNWIPQQSKKQNFYFGHILSFVRFSTTNRRHNFMYRMVTGDISWSKSAFTLFKLYLGTKIYVVWYILNTL